MIINFQIGNHVITKNGRTYADLDYNMDNIVHVGG